MLRKRLSSATMVLLILLAAVALTGVITPTRALADEGDAAKEELPAYTVSYIDSTGEVSDATGCKMLPEARRKERGLSGGWYLLAEDECITGGLQVTGDCNVIIGNATLTMCNAYITINEGAALHLYCMPGWKDRATIELPVYTRGIRNYGTFEMNGCTITGNPLVAVSNYEGSTATMYGGKIENGDVGVEVVPGSSFFMYGGTIASHKDCSVLVDGGDMHVMGTPWVERVDLMRKDDLITVDGYLVKNDATSNKSTLANIGVHPAYEGQIIKGKHCGVNDASSIFHAVGGGHIRYAFGGFDCVYEAG